MTTAHNHDDEGVAAPAPESGGDRDEADAPGHSGGSNRDHRLPLAPTKAAVVRDGYPWVIAALALLFALVCKSSPWPVGRTARGRVIARARGEPPSGAGTASSAGGSAAWLGMHVRRSPCERQASTDDRAAHAIIAGVADSSAGS